MHGCGSFPELIQIFCPVQETVISSLQCDACENRIRVLFRSETPPELRCTRWDWSLTAPGPDLSP